VGFLTAGINSGCWWVMPVILTKGKLLGLLKKEKHAGADAA
jgi:hypothetical protein